MTDTERLAALEQALAQLAERDARIAQLEALVATLAARVAELEARLGQNSSNSSKPPSSDPPSAPAKPATAPSGRKPGGQKGHRGHHRARRPPDHVVDHKPPACRRCGAGLCGDDPDPQWHQVTEVPPPRAEVTEHRLHTLACRDCGAATTATLPPEVPRGAFGPRLAALVAVATGVYRVGKRDAAGLVNDWFGVEMSLGAVTACEQVVSAALAPPVEAARAYVQAQPVAHADETSWRQGRRKAWLWVAATTLVTVFLIHAKRSQAAAQALLGTFAGILVSDRWNAYNPWSVERRQLCWAHLVRHFRAWAQWPERSTARVGKALVAQTDEMFRAWHRVRDGTLTRSAFQVEMVERQAQIETLLRACVASGTRKYARMAEEILKLRPALWTFVHVEGVAPTNNHAERQIRRGVLWRKNCFGTHSEAGSRFAERMLTTVATLKQQGRNIVAFVADACQARQAGQVTPSLLPPAATPT